MSPNSPVFAFDREGRMTAFESVADAEVGIELNDIWAREFAVFDVEGRRLEWHEETAVAHSGFLVQRAQTTYLLVEAPGRPMPDLVQRAVAEAIGDEALARLPLPELASRALETRWQKSPASQAIRSLRDDAL